MKNLLLIIFCAFGAMNTFAQKGDDLLGIWHTEDEKSRIEIIKKSDGKYYGSVIWLKEPYEEDGKTIKVDDENPDPKKRATPIVGLELLKELTWDGEEWDDGEIYDPQSGNTYSSMATMPDVNTIKMRGYMVFSLLGRTTVWTRVPKDKL